MNGAFFHPNTKPLAPTELAAVTTFFDGHEIESVALNAETTFGQIYEFIGYNGLGSFGIVVKVVEKQTGDLYAIKVIKKVNSSDSHINRLREEAHILKSLNHKNIIKLAEVYESDDYLFLVMDQMDGGSLATLMQKRGRLCENEASIIMKGIFSGLNYIHMKGFIHRDIKPDNILLQSENDLSSLKIADFGLGVKLEVGFSQSPNKLCGTVIYMAPEQASSNSYGMNVDMWACGIILFTLLTGEHPLYRDTDTHDSYLEKLKSPKWVFPNCFGELAKNLFLRCCNANISKRYETMNALQHPWVTRDVNDAIPKTTLEELEDRELSKKQRIVRK